MRPARFAPFFLVVGLTASAQEVTLKRDVPYREGSNPAWRLDIAYPTARSARPRPCVVVIHGGGWLEGDKSSFAFLDRKAPANIVDFARRGYVAATVNYRMSREAPFPAALEDCKAAVRFLRLRAGDYGIAPDRIGAYGNSAGGHLALLLAMVGPEHGFEGDANRGPSSLVRAAVSDSGPVDLIRQEKDSQIAEVVRRFLGGKPEGDRIKTYRAASPMTYVSAKTPSLLLIYGASDLQVPVVATDDFVAALGKAGADDVTYLRLAFVDHCPHSLVALPRMQVEIDEFFDRVLMHPETAREVRRWKR